MSGGTKIPHSKHAAFRPYLSVLCLLYVVRMEEEIKKVPKDVPKKTMPSYVNFIIAGMSGVMAICICQPMDLLKTRMQLLHKSQSHMNFITVARQILKKEGFRGYYAGISAAIFRQCTYTAVRLGTFNATFDMYYNKYGAPTFLAKVGMGMFAGVVGSYVGTPAEVVLIRMTADGRLPRKKRRNYFHVFDALARIIQEEGVTTLWRGAVVTMTRAMIVSGVQLSSYTQSREMLLPTIGDGLQLHSCCAMISGLITTLISMPFDIVKTRTQNAKKAKDIFKIIRQVIKQDGILGLWSGTLPTYAKVGPATILLFVFMEQLNALYYRVASAYHSDDDGLKKS